MANPGKPPTLNDDQRAVDIYRKAADILCTKGFGATSMSDIAEAVDLTKGGLYYYIKGKSALLYAIMCYALDRLEALVLIPAQSIEDPRERLSVLVAGHLRLLLDEPSTMRVLASQVESLATQHHARVVARRARFGDLLATTIDDVLAANSPARPSPIDPGVAAGCIRTMVDGVLDWYDLDGPIGRQQLVDQVVHLALAALGADSTASTATT